MTYKRLELDKVSIVSSGSETYIFFWKGDWIQDTVALMLCARGLEAINYGLFVSVRGVSPDALVTLLCDLAATPPREDELMQHVANQQQEKWDFLVPGSLLAKNYASHNLDTEGARETMRKLVNGSRM